MNTADTEGGLRDDMLPPSGEDNPPLPPTHNMAPLSFSMLTPSKFGISVQSFTPATTPNLKDKSRLAQLKSRRRSNVGVRGSPETNSLIRFMAQNRAKTPPSKTPQHGRRSPFTPTLRQKMASFQRLMDVDESEACDAVPGPDHDIGGRTETRDYLSDGNDKENNPPLQMPSSKKRRCLGPVESCEVEIREASAPLLHFDLKQQEDMTVSEDLIHPPLITSGAVEVIPTELISPPLPPSAASPAKKHKGDFFELQSFSRPPAAVSSFHFPSLSGLPEIKPTGDDESTRTGAVKQKKRVRFGGPLSPEFFDKYLPPSTPLQKGGTPARAATPGVDTHLRSLLKTPQRSEAHTPQAPQDDCSPTEFGASPVLVFSHKFKKQSAEEGDDEKSEKVVSFSVDEPNCETGSDTGYLWDTQPLNLNSAFQEESLSEPATESETEPSSNSHPLTVDEPSPSPEEEKPDAPTPTRSSSRRKKPTAVFQSPVHSHSRKRKQPEENEPVKRSTRSAAKTASGKMKLTAAATRQWQKDVDRSLYGSRDYASKNPTLSPIKERRSLTSQCPAGPQTLASSCEQHTAASLEIDSAPETANNVKATGELTVTHDVGNPVIESKLSKGRSLRKGRRLSGQKSRGRGVKKSKFSVVDCDVLGEEPLEQKGGETKGQCEAQAAADLEESSQHHAAPIQREKDTELKVETFADEPRSDSDGKSERPTSLYTLPLSDEELSSAPAQLSHPNTETASGSAYSSVAQEQGEQVQECQTSREGENKQGEQAENQIESSCRSSSDGQEEEGPSHTELAPWQTDFNFEDVFKPVPTRGQRSVRRSLRNRGNAAHSSTGLAWLPQTPPESSKEAHRRTRGRRLSAALPVQSSVSEETQDNAS